MTRECVRRHQQLEKEPRSSINGHLQRRAVNSVLEMKEEHDVRDSPKEDREINTYYSFLNTPLLVETKPSIQPKENNYSASQSIKTGSAYPTAATALPYKKSDPNDLDCSAVEEKGTKNPFAQTGGLLQRMKRRSEEDLLNEPKDSKREADQASTEIVNYWNVLPGEITAYILEMAYGGRRVMDRFFPADLESLRYLIHLRTVSKGFKESIDIFLLNPAIHTAPTWKIGTEENTALGIQDTVRGLIHDYPPEKCLYISIGNSPAPLALYMQLVSAGSVAVEHLPISGLTPHTLDNSDTTDYLERFIKDLPVDRIWVFLDITATGAALMTIDAYLRKKKERGEKIPEHVVVSVNKLRAAKRGIPTESEEKPLMISTELAEDTPGGYTLSGDVKGLIAWSSYMEYLANQLVACTIKKDMKAKLYDFLSADGGVKTATLDQLKDYADLKGIARLLRLVYECWKRNEAYEWRKSKGTEPWDKDDFD